MPEATKEAHNATVAETNNKKLEFIEEVTKNAHQIQKRVLQEILSKNASVEYLKRHGLKGCTEREKFKKIMPVVTYEDILRDINRIAAGDASPILCADPISEFLTSSGTSGGERKMMPTIEEELDRRSMLYSLLMPVMSQFIEGLDQGKGMYFLFIKSETRTPAGLPARPVLTSYYKSPHFKNRPFDPYTNYTSPNEAILCPDSYQSMYSQILCGLAQNRHVIRLGAVFASGFIRAIRFLEKNWALLCHDIKTGTVNELVTDPFVREAVSRVVTPDPELAEFVESECRRDDRRGIIVRVWPNAKYIDVIVTGAMAQYIPTLDYYGGGLPLVSTMYASSECYFGINLNPLCNPSDVAYTLIPTMCYYEFLPIEKNNRKEQPKLGELGQDLGELVDLVDVKLGHEYELIVTTYAGLYRYRVGDVLRVAGFKNSAPQFNFVCRKNVVLSIDTDKTDEVELHTAVTNAARNLTPFDAALTEYTSYADTAAIPGHYVLYWEVSRNECAPIPPAVLEECCLAVEESLGSVYRQNRVCEAIGALEIRVVENGTFDKVMDYAISEGGSINQYKTPRCVKFAPIVELLDSKVAAAYYSRDCPKWTTPALNHWTCTK